MIDKLIWMISTTFTFSLQWIISGYWVPCFTIIFIGTSPRSPSSSTHGNKFPTGDHRSPQISNQYTWFYTEWAFSQLPNKFMRKTLLFYSLIWNFTVAIDTTRWNTRLIRVLMEKYPHQGYFLDNVNKCHGYSYGFNNKYN